MSSLPIIYDGVREPVLDIVSIPGLPDLLPQYQVKDHNRWLREVLSHQIPGARIMSFHYDFAIFPTSVTWKDLTDQVLRLLYALVHRRETTQESNRSILFICYSFGAFILKKALLLASQQSEFRSILDSTAGIIFLGCLHNERHPEFEDLCLRCAAVELRTTAKKSPAIESLKASDEWPVVKEVMESFRELRKSFPVRSFFELKQTVYHSTRFIGTKQCCLCPEVISALGWEHEKVIGVNVDHGQLSMFPSRSDSFFEVLVEHLTEVVNDILPPTSMPARTNTCLYPPIGEDWAAIRSINSSTASLTLSPATRSSLSNLLVTDFLPSLPATTLKLPCFVTTPHQENPEFVGREDIEQAIHAALGPTEAVPPAQRTFALCGLGGMGKTQTAVDYVFRHRADFSAVLFAPADSRAKLAESFSRFTVELGLSDEMGSDQNTGKQILKDWLRITDEPWLLVFDNADSVDKDDLLKEFWPETDRGSVLITSRDKTLTNQFNGIELRALDKTSAVNLLMNLTKFNRARLSRESVDVETSAAEKIVHQIGYLPLGIRQAANLIVNESSSLTDFLEAYNNRELIEDAQSVKPIKNPLSTYQYSLGTVWNMNFEGLSADQQSLLNIMAFLDPDRIHVDLLEKGASKSSHPGLRFISTTRKLYKGKVALIRSSLVSQNEELRELEMHRLVQASCHLRMNEMDRGHHFGMAVSLVKHCWPVPPRTLVHNPSLWKEQQAFLPHVQSLCQYYVDSCKEELPLIPPDEVNWDFPAILYEAGWFCYERGLLQSVSALLKVAEEYCLVHIDEGGEVLLADIYGGLGSLDTESNQFQGAYDHFEKQWHYVQKALEKGRLQRPTIWEVFGLGRLGNGLHGLHRYSEAEAYYRKCLKAWEQVPGDRRIFTTHLATCLWLQGRLKEAEETVTGIIKDRYDTTNFRTGQALFSLGNIQIAQGDELTKDGKAAEADVKYNEAHETHGQALLCYQKALGHAHHKTADALHKMGWHLHRMHDYKNSVVKLTQALEIYKSNTVFFKNEIARTKYKLGCVYQDLGDKENGREEIKEAERLRKEIVPPEKWAPALYEESFDDIVQFWSR